MPWQSPLIFCNMVRISEGEYIFVAGINVAKSYTLIVKKRVKYISHWCTNRDGPFAFLFLLYFMILDTFSWRKSHCSDAIEFPWLSRFFYKYSSKPATLTIHSKPFTNEYITAWKRFPCYRYFMDGIYRSPGDSPHKGPVMRNFMFYLGQPGKKSWFRAFFYDVEICACVCASFG